MFRWNNPFLEVLRFLKMGGASEWSILMAFSIINHPFWGIPIYGNPHMVPNTNWTSSSHISSCHCRSEQRVFHLQRPALARNGIPKMMDPVREGGLASWHVVEQSVEKTSDDACQCQALPPVLKLQKESPNMFTSHGGLCIYIYIYTHILCICIYLYMYNIYIIYYICIIYIYICIDICNISIYTYVEYIYIYKLYYKLCIYIYVCI